MILLKFEPQVIQSLVHMHLKIGSDIRTKFKSIIKVLNFVSIINIFIIEQQTVRFMMKRDQIL